MKPTTPNSHGGARKGAGRKSTDGAENLQRVSVNLREDQRAKFAQLGGSAWLRALVDAAP